MLLLVSDVGMRQLPSRVPALFLAQTQQISQVSTVDRGPHFASLTLSGLVSPGENTRGPSTQQCGEGTACVSV